MPSIARVGCRHSGGGIIFRQADGFWPPQNTKYREKREKPLGGPPSGVERGVGRLLFRLFMMVFPHDGKCPVRLWCQVVKELRIMRGRLGALLLIAQYLLTPRPPSLGVGIQSGKRSGKW